MKELLAIHFAVTYLRPYLYGQRFTVRSDHKPLVFLYNVKNPASKLTQIRLDLDEYDFVVEHVPGKHNVVADALSRIHVKDIKTMEMPENTVCAITRSMTRNIENDSKHETRQTKTDEADKISVYEEINRKKLKNIPEIIFYIEKTRKSSRAHMKIIMKKQLIFDKIIDDIEQKNGIINGELLSGEFLSVLQQCASDLQIFELKFKMNNEIFSHITHEKFMLIANKILHDLIIMMYNSTKLVHEPTERKTIIEQFHQNAILGGHFGVKKTYESIKREYYWPNMSKEITTFIKNCDKCTLNKPKPRTKEHMTITDTPNKPFDTMIIDTVGPLTKSFNGNRYALTMICDLSKFLITVAIPNKEAKTIAKAIFEHLILLHGPMKIMRTDLGTEYRNEVIGELCELMNIKHNMSTAYHHESVGTVERSHRVLNEYLRSYMIDDNWEEHLKHFTFCYNISYNASNDHQYTPYEIVYGRGCNLPNTITNKIEPLYNVDNYIKTQKFILQKIHSDVRKLINKNKEINKQSYDKNVNPLEIEENDTVLMKKEPYNKFKPIYSGPHIVKHIQGPNVTIMLDGKPYRVHKNRLIKT